MGEMEAEVSTRFLLEGDVTDKTTDFSYFFSSLNKLAVNIHSWSESKHFETNYDNVPEKLMFIVSELSEALEAARDDNWRDFEEEVADALIRLLDMSAGLGLNLTKAVHDKMIKNEGRAMKHGRKNYSS